MLIYVDIDETICHHLNNHSTAPRDYSGAIPIYENIKKINKLYDEGNKIFYWTARGTTTGIDWGSVTRQQLKDWGVKYHELHLKKPAYDLFICDKTKRIEEI
jgi:hypothetical protein